MGAFTTCTPAAFPRILPVLTGKTISNPPSMTLVNPATVVAWHASLSFQSGSPRRREDRSTSSGQGRRRLHEARNHVVAEAKLVGTYSQLNAGVAAQEGGESKP
jgi:hypothetical protein